MSAELSLAEELCHDPPQMNAAVLSSHPVFNGVAPPVLQFALAEGKLQSFERQQLLLQEGHSDLRFFVLLRGSVRVFYSGPEGVEVVAKIFLAPAVFGEMECLSNIPYLENVAAMEKVDALVLPRDTLVQLTKKSPAFAHNLMVDLAKRLCIAAHNERALAFHRVEVRLANVLQTYLDAYGLPTYEGTKIRIRLTQSDLANHLGVTRRSITRALRSWHKDGVVTQNGGFFFVHQPERLKALTDPTLFAIGHRSK